MIIRHIMHISILLVSIAIVSCGGNDKKKEEAIKKEPTISATTDDIVPKIDTAALKDEASILSAMEKVVEARIADEKKRNENPNYSGHLAALMRLHTTVLRASMDYTRSISDPAKKLEFERKFNEIEKKLDTNR